MHVDEFGIGHHAHFLGLHEADRFLPAGGDDIHVVDDDLLGRRGDRHQAGRALAVDRHARGADRAPGTQRDLAREIARLRALLERRAPEHVVDLTRLDPGAFDRGRKRIGAERGAPGVVEPALVGAADGGAGCGYDDCVA